MTTMTAEISTLPRYGSWLDLEAAREATRIMNENFARSGVYGDGTDPGEYLARQLAAEPTDAHGIGARARDLIRAAQAHPGDVMGPARLYNDQKMPAHSNHVHADDPRPLSYATLCGAIRDWVHSHHWLSETGLDGVETLTVRRYASSDTPGKTTREYAASRLGEKNVVVKIGHGATRPVWLPETWTVIA